MKAPLEEVQKEYMRLKGGPNSKSTMSLLDVAKIKSWEPDEFKLALIMAEQSSEHVSKSPRRNHRREKRQALMREKYNL